MKTDQSAGKGSYLDKYIRNDLLGGAFLGDEFPYRKQINPKKMR